MAQIKMEHSSSVLRPPSFVFGIDASRAVSEAPTGTEYYSRALIDALLGQDSPFSFRLYTRTIPLSGYFAPTDKYELCAIPFPRLWTHLRLSYEMVTRPPDALFVPSHVLPPIHPRNSLVTVHDLGYLHYPHAHPRLTRIYLDLTTRWNARAARVVVADSNTTRADLIRLYGVAPDRIRVVYPSYNADIFKPIHEQALLTQVREKYHIGKQYVLTVGTLHPRKNYARLIQASVCLPPEYQLVIVGKKGWLYDAIFPLVQELGLTDRVRFLDYVPAEDLCLLYASAAALVFPSLYEGFGFPALEAQACEVPLICSNASSLPEVAGEGAEYFDPENVEAMGAAMLRVLNSDTRRVDLIDRGRANLARFSWERAAQEIVEIVKSL